MPNPESHSWKILAAQGPSGNLTNKAFHFDIRIGSASDSGFIKVISGREILFQPGDRLYQFAIPGALAHVTMTWDE